MTRESRMKELQLLDAARRKFMTFTQQQKEAELSRLDDEIRRKVGHRPSCGAKNHQNFAQVCPHCANTFFGIGKSAYKLITMAGLVCID